MLVARQELTLVAVSVSRQELVTVSVVRQELVLVVRQEPGELVVVVDSVVHSTMYFVKYFTNLSQIRI